MRPRTWTAIASASRSFFECLRRSSPCKSSSRCEPGRRQSRPGAPRAWATSPTSLRTWRIRPRRPCRTGRRNSRRWCARPDRRAPAQAPDQHERGIALGIEIDDQHALPGPRRSRVSQHDGDGRLADATFPVRHRQKPRHSLHPPRKVFAVEGVMRFAHRVQPPTDGPRSCSWLAMQARPRPVPTPAPI